MNKNVRENYVVSVIVHFITREETRGKEKDGEPEFIFSMRPRGIFVVALRYPR